MRPYRANSRWKPSSLHWPGKPGFHRQVQAYAGVFCNSTQEVNSERLQPFRCLSYSTLRKKRNKRTGGLCLVSLCAFQIRQVQAHAGVSVVANGIAIQWSVFCLLVAFFVSKQVRSPAGENRFSRRYIEAIQEVSPGRFFCLVCAKVSNVLEGAAFDRLRLNIRQSKSDRPSETFKQKSFSKIMVSIINPLSAF